MHTLRYVIAVGLSLPVAIEGVWAQKHATNANVKDIIVLLDQENVSKQLTAESIVELMGSSEDRGSQKGVPEIASMLGAPESARFLVVDRIPDELRNTFEPDSPQERLQRYVVLSYRTVEEARIQLDRLSLDSRVISVELDREFEFSVAPTDPRFSPPFVPVPDPLTHQWQWGLQLPQMNLLGAWTKTFGTAYVGVLDSGTQESHPDLVKRWSRGFAHRVVTATAIVDEMSGTTNNAAGHGTHVATTIGSRTAISPAPTGYINPSAINGAGACWECGLIIVRISSDTHSLSYSRLAAGVTYATSTGAQVINMSLGFAENVNCASPSGTHVSICDALALAESRQVLIVAAAGNSQSMQVDFPAADSRGIAVGGLQYPGVLWQGDGIYGSNGGSAILFSFTNNAGDYYYTVVPQMGAAYVLDQLEPRSIRKNLLLSTELGATVPRNGTNYSFPRYDSTGQGPALGLHYACESVERVSTSSAFAPLCELQYVAL